MRPGKWVAICAFLLAGTTSAQDQNEDAPDDPAQPEPQQAAAPDASAPDRNVDLVELVEQVAATSDRDFVIHMRSNRSVYVGGTGLEDPSYPELLAILRNNDLVAVEIEGLVNIFPSDFGRTASTPIVQEDDPSIPDNALVARVISVPAQRSAAQLVPILRPLMPREAHLAAAGDQNKLIIVDRYANVRRITELVNALNQ